jgi:hypothetical protein
MQTIHETIEGGISKLFLAELHEDLRKLQRKIVNPKTLPEPGDVAFEIEEVLMKIRDRSTRVQENERGHGEEDGNQIDKLRQKHENEEEARRTFG